MEVNYSTDRGFLFFYTGTLFFFEGTSFTCKAFFSYALHTRPRTLANHTYPTHKPKFAKELALLTTHRARSIQHETDKKAHPQKIKTLKKLYSTMGIEKNNIRYENINPLYCHSTVTIKTQLLTHG